MTIEEKNILFSAMRKADDAFYTLFLPESRESMTSAKAYETHAEMKALESLLYGMGLYDEYIAWAIACPCDIESR